MNSLPSFDELDQSLNLPNPPVRVYTDDGLDNDIFNRLDKQAKVNTKRHHLSYASPSWDGHKILNTNHKNRILELFSQSGQKGIDGYDIKTHTTGTYKDEQVVCIYKTAVTANELLPIIKK